MVSNYLNATWPDDIPMHGARSLDQLTNKFQSVRDGLPELIKNSKDQYARLGVTERSERQILVLVHSRRQRLAVIDFAGADSGAFGRWRVWSGEPPATDRTLDIEAGYGNGGKSFMARGATVGAFMESVLLGRRTKMLFNNSIREKRYFPGYALENGVNVDALAVDEPNAHFNQILQLFGSTIEQLPQSCARIFDRRRAYTAVLLDGVRGWNDSRRRRHIDDLLGHLRDHSQAALTLESCEVRIIIDGVARDGVLEPERPEPYAGFEYIEPIPVPTTLIDPQSGLDVPTGSTDDSRHVLSLHTSKRQLRMSHRDVAKNILRVRSERNIAGFWTLLELEPSALSSHVWGDVTVPGIADSDQIGSDRERFADTPLPRALKNWVSSNVHELTAQIMEAQVRRTRPEDDDYANGALNRLRDLMREFLAHETPGERPGDNPHTTERRRVRRPQGTKLDGIEIEGGRDSLTAASGTTVPLLVESYEESDDKERLPFRPRELLLQSDAPESLELIGRDQLQLLRPGMFLVKLFDPDSNIESNEILVESLAATSVTIEPPTGKLKRGERRRIRTIFETPPGQRDDVVISASIDDSSLASIGRSGMFTAGDHEGTVLLTIRFGALPGDTTAIAIEIGSERQAQEFYGSDIPVILLCGHGAPGTADLPPQQRTYEASPDLPTIHEDRALFPNVVWLNQLSLESQQVRRSRGGSGGLMRINTPTFTQFLALKCFDILKRLWVRQSTGESELTELEFINQLQEAEIECKDFIPAAYELALDIARGDEQ